MTIIEKTLQEQIHEMLRYLAGNCDGAARNDGAGFNKLDATIGHQLAYQESLAPKDIKIGAKLLRRYHRQLENAGYILPDFSGIDEYIKTLPVVPIKPTIGYFADDDRRAFNQEPQQQEDKTTNNPDEITLSGEQQTIFELMEKSRQHLFITGRAGTGKSVLLRHFREHTEKRVVVAAPTGIAALNVKGQTIHSLFKLPPQLHRKGRLARNERACSLLKRIDVLVIDEISMVRADLLDAVDERLREAFDSDAPFGGIQVIMFGDPYQLPPVVEEGLVPYMEYTHGGYFFFNALVWRETEFKIYELTQVFRQKDPTFRDILNAVRDGTVVDPQIKQLNARHSVAIPDEGTVTLAPTNSLVTEINQQRLERLPGKAYQYQAEIVGEMKKSVFPTEEKLFLKEGAQVVLLKNDKDGRWVNGSVGTINKLEEKIIDVRVDGIVYTLERETWEEIVYTYDQKTNKIEAKTQSSFTQYPIRLAWAMTIHKSQGQTYESVSLDLSSPTFAPGQLYVALSRATSLEGLYLKLPILRKHIIVDPKVAEFMARRETIVVEVKEEETQMVVAEIVPEPITATSIIVDSTLVPQEDKIIEVPTQDIVHTESIEEKPRNPKGAGRKRKEDLVRVNIKLSKKQQELTEKIDRSKLIRKLLDAHFGIEE